MLPQNNFEVGLIHICLKGFIGNILEDNDCCMGVGFVIGGLCRWGCIMGGGVGSEVCRFG